MRYKLEKKIDGEWYLEGIYNTPTQLANACFYLGKINAKYDDLRVTEVQ